jgi:hypothetical protein
MDEYFEKDYKEGASSERETSKRFDECLSLRKKMRASISILVYLSPLLPEDEQTSNMGGCQGSASIV